jgi:hypothetical protein
MTKLTLLRSLTVACGVFGGATFGWSQAPSSSEKATVPARPASDKAAEPARPATPAAKPTHDPRPEGVSEMAREFGQQSKDLAERRKALIERLRSAKTEEEKERIIAELRQQQKQRLEQQREVARQIREQMQTTRRETGAAASGGR